MLLTGASQATAQQTLHIGNDRGGSLTQRIAMLDRINRSGNRVAITGAICFSACTLYLGAPGVCVSPHTRFGFHGPSMSGRPLSSDRFEYWSQVMAHHYPPALRDWFLRTGRHRITGYYELTGRDLYSYGIAAC